jgi:hypothetical protein
LYNGLIHDRNASTGLSKHVYLGAQTISGGGTKKFAQRGKQRKVYLKFRKQIPAQADSRKKFRAS